MPEHSKDADIAFIKALAELLRENDLTELEVKREHGEDASLRVRVSRGTAPVVSAAPHWPAPHPPTVPNLPVPVTGAAHGAPATDDIAASDPAAHPGAVTSPMVGTVYLSSEPGADPFVKVGEVVAEGQTLLIVEAMKTMNQIPSPRTGTVKRILIEDGSPVEYGAPLMIVE